MLRHFYSIQDPMSLTLRKWSALIETMGYVRLLEEGGATDSDHIERENWLRKRRGW